MLCRPAHGHAGAIGILPASHLPATAGAGLDATFALLRAALYQHIYPTKDEAEAEREAEMIGDRYMMFVRDGTDPGLGDEE